MISIVAASEFETAPMVKNVFICSVVKGSNKDVERHFHRR